MNIAKVIGNDGVNVQLGFQNGTFITVPAQQIGFLAPIGMLIDVYENTQNGITVYQYVQHQGNFGGGFGGNSNFGTNIANTISSEINTGKTVNKTTYCLLAFFLGGFGVHKFYAGQIALGIIYMVFSWTFIPMFIAAIEGIVAICKNADIYGNITV